jgi:DNA-binding NtrC family response regulator
MSNRVLIVDDDVEMCRMLEARLAKRGYEVTWKTSAPEALGLVEREDFDALVTDLNMKGMDGIELCERLAGARPDVPVLVITAFGSLDSAVAAMRSGAYDYLTKPFEIEQLDLSLKRAIQHRVLREEVRRLRKYVEQSHRFEKLLGASDPMQKLFDMIERVAGSDASVLITGESGTGKELVARAVHQRSRRKDGPFVALSCAAVPENLLESELFGYEKGAFTDAKSSRRGLLVQSGGGTIFLDEIGDMPLPIQPKLLRALQEKVVRPIGGDREVPFDARIITATNRDMESMLEEKTFREDLYFRINVVHLEVPPLRSRGSDVLLLAQEFLERFAVQAGKQVRTLASLAAEKIMAHDWPGNVRELQNCMERAVALARYDTITVEDLPEKMRGAGPPQVIVEGNDPSELLSMDEVERRYIVRVLAAAGGNKTMAARVLGFDRRTLYRKLAHYGLGGEGKDEG